MKKGDRGRMIEHAVILAGGLGTRMQEPADGVALTDAEQLSIDKGLKGMITADDKRPIFDSTIQNLLDARIEHLIFVVNNNGRRLVEEYYGFRLSGMVELSYAIQPVPLGTADAVLAAENHTGDYPFLVMCYDNVYPLESVKQLVRYDNNWSAIGFDRDALEDSSLSNLRREKVRQCAAMQVDEDYNLVKIVEAAGDEQDNYALPDGRVLISMSLFGFDYRIYKACSRIEPHPERGELELPSAVQFGIDEMGIAVKVLYHYGGVIDLTAQEDIEGARRLTHGRKLGF